MRAIYPKFLGKKSELFGIEMKDIFVCMGMISITKLFDLSDLIIILIPGIYLLVKFLLNLFRLILPYPVLLRVNLFLPLVVIMMV